MKLIFLMLFPLFLMAQTSQIKERPFAATDTIGNITAQDTLSVQLGQTGTADWHTITTYISASDKTSEKEILIKLEDEDWWTWTPSIRFKISSGSYTITSEWVNIGGTEGRTTFFIIPDTVGTNTYYFNSYVGGN